MGDIKFILNTHGTSVRGGTPVSPAQLRRLPQLAFQELYKAFDELGTTLTFELKFYFYKMIHERPRNEAYKGGRSEKLLSRMQKAFVHQVTGDRNTLNLMVFDLAQIDRDTRGEGFNTGWKGWFMRFADGHEGRRHGGVGWGFIEHKYAMELARECAAKFITDPQKRQHWLMEMNEVFKGRHGEGIMTRLDAPLFKMFPHFGPAKAFIKKHPGFYSWPALGIVGQEMQRRRGWVADHLQQAFDTAVSKL